MKVEILAVLIQEGTKLCSELLRLRSHSPKRTKDYQSPISPPAESQEIIEETPTGENKATSVEAGCVPCSIGHLGTCVGVTNEANRFAKKDGIASKEVIDRVNICIDELNALERIDLRPEMIAGLPTWEKGLADAALLVSRETRHSLESLSSAGELESVAAKLQTSRQQIGREWFKQRLARMSPEEKEKLTKKAMEKLEEE